MKLVGHKCVGSAVTQAARYKPYDPQNLHVNPIRTDSLFCECKIHLYVSIIDFQKIQIKMLCKIVASKEARSSSNALVHVFPC